MHNKRIYLAALFVAAACFPGTEASADRISFHTTKAVGDSITITLNANVQTTLTWGDGSTKDVFFNGSPVTLSVASDTLTIVTTNTIKTLDVSDCGLTTLNLTRATAIEALSCADNDLTTLTVSSLKALKSLDCSNNRLSSLLLFSCTSLNYLNFADNQIETITLSGNTKLRTLICSGNRLTSLALTKLTDLEFLWAQDNQLTKLDVSANTKLKTLIASNNALTELTVDDASAMKELWLDGNNFETLALKPMTKLERLSADRNQLQSVTFYHYYKTSLKYCYLQENALAFNSFPYVYNKTTGEVKIHSSLAPQAPIALPEYILAGGNVDFSSLVKTCAGGTSVMPAVTWKRQGTDEVLTEGEDYTNVSKGKFTFHKVLGKIYGVIEAPEYPGVVLTTSVMNVADPDGIKNTTANRNLAVKTRPGQLEIAVSNAPAHITIFTASGTQVTDADYAPGTHIWQLQPGIYVVNGTKITLP